MQNKYVTGCIFPLILALLFPVVATAATPMPNCEGSVLSACVGECGNPFIGSHVVTAEDVQSSAKMNHASFCLTIDQETTSLCPSEDIRYQLSVNGKVTKSGELGYGFGDAPSGLIRLKVKEGELVTVELEHFFDHLNIACIVLGDANLDLTYYNK